MKGKTMIATKKNGNRIGNGSSTPSQSKVGPVNETTQVESRRTTYAYDEATHSLIISMPLLEPRLSGTGKTYVVGQVTGKLDKTGLALGGKEIMVTATAMIFAK